MSASGTTASGTPDNIRKAWSEAHVAPLWEQLAAHNTELQRDRAFIWKWRSSRSAVGD